MLDELINTGTKLVSRETQTVTRVALDRIVDNPFQYRQQYNEAPLRELAININSLVWQLPKTSGLQQPGMGRLVRRDDAGVETPLDAAAYANQVALARLFDAPDVYVQLAYGHRRVRAFHILATGPKQFFPNTRADDWPKTEPSEFGTFPLQLAHLDDQAMAEFALTENSQREDVSAIEEAGLLQRMIDELGLSIEDVGRKFGWGRSTVSNKLRLLRLPAGVQKHVLAGDLSEKHARQLLRLEDAPNMLASIADKCRSEMWPTRKLDERIKEAIYAMRAVPDTQIEMFNTYGSVKVKPPWDLSWAPAGGNMRGACSECPARIVFGNEPAPRCVDPACYEAKNKVWPAEDEKRQRAAVKPILVELNGAGLLLNVMDENGARPIKILDKPYSYQERNSVHAFDPSHMEEAVLRDSGICGPHCKCFAACYEPPSRSYGWESYRPTRWRPAPDVAPDICFCCTDLACFAGQLQAAKGEAEQRQKMEDAAELAADPELAARRAERAAQEAAQQKAAKERKAQAQHLADGAVAAAGGVDTLWSNRAFLVDLAALSTGDYYNRPSRSQLDGKSVDELRGMIISRVLLGQFYMGGQLDLEAIQTLANRIAPAKPQPGPGDSQTTDWQAGWDENDECTYQDLMSVWDSGDWRNVLGIFNDTTPTTRVLLRLIEACPDKTVRAKLWQRHNSLAAGV